MFRQCVKTSHEVTHSVDDKKKRAQVCEPQLKTILDNIDVNTEIIPCSSSARYKPAKMTYSICMRFLPSTGIVLKHGWPIVSNGVRPQASGFRSSDVVCGGVA